MGAHDYNEFYEYLDKIIPMAEVKKFESEFIDKEKGFNVKTAEEDSKTVVKDYISSQFEADVDAKVDAGNISYKQGESMKKNFSPAAQDLVDLKVTRVVSRDRRKYVNLDKFTYLIERNMPVIERDESFVTRVSEDLIQKEKALLRKKDKVISEVNTTQDIALSATFKDYSDFFKKNKIKMDEELHRTELVEKLQDRGVININLESDYDYVKKLARENKIDTRMKDYKGMISRRSDALNLLAVRMNLTGKEEEREAKYIDEQRSALVKLREIALVKGFKDGVIQNSFKNPKKLDNWELKLLHKKTIDSGTSFYKKSYDILDSYEKQGTGDLGKLSIIKNQLDDPNVSINPWQKLELERKLSETEKSMKENVIKVNNRSPFELKEILSLKGVSDLDNKSDSEIKRLARTNNISLSRKKVNSFEEKLITLARLKSNRESEFKNNIVDLKSQNLSDKELDVRLESYLDVKTLTRTRKKPAYLTRDDLPGVILGKPKLDSVSGEPVKVSVLEEVNDFLKFKNLRISKKDFDKERNRYISQLSKATGASRKSIPSISEIDNVVAQKLLFKTIDVPILEFEVEKKFKELEGIPSGVELNIDQKKRLLKQLNNKDRVKTLFGKGWSIKPVSEFEIIGIGAPRIVSVPVEPLRLSDVKKVKSSLKKDISLLESLSFASEDSVVNLDLDYLSKGVSGSVADLDLSELESLVSGEIGVSKKRGGKVKRVSDTDFLSGLSDAELESELRKLNK